MGQERDRAEARLAVEKAGNEPVTGEHLPGIARGVQAASLVFFLALVIATMLAGLGLLDDGLAGPVLTVFQWFIVFGSVAQTVATLIRVGTSPDERTPVCENDLGFPRAIRAYRLLLRVTTLALVVGGYYELAALLVYLICLGVARRVEDRRILGDLKQVDPVSRGIHAAIYATAGVLLPIVRPVGKLLMWRGIANTPFIAVVLSLPFWLVYLLFLIPFRLVHGLFLIPFTAVKSVIDWFRTRRGDRAVVEQLRAAGTRAYFVYSEPHQREHFLGKNGVLKPLAHRVLARDWRVDLAPIRQALQGRPVAGADAMFLRRFRLSRMKDDLPFVAILGKGGKIHPFYCSAPYRQRRRDGGVALIRTEDDIRDVLEKYIAASPAAG